MMILWMCSKVDGKERADDDDEHEEKEEEGEEKKLLSSTFFIKLNEKSRHDEAVESEWEWGHGTKTLF